MDESREGKEKIDLKILLADDTPATLEFFKAALKLKYTSVETAENGRLLMEQLSDPNKSFDFLVTDYFMPGMTGLEALRQIRATEHLKNLPVVIMSGELDYADIKREAEMFGAIFLVRPIDIDDLTGAIEKLRLKGK